MSFEMMKKAVIGAAGAVALMGAVNVQASSIVSADADFISSFSGMSNLSQSGLGIGCTLTLNGSVAKVAGTQDVVITVTSGSATGGIFSGCGLVNLGFSPAWTATVPAADLPVSDETISGTFDNVQVGTDTFGPCTPTPAMGVPATFTNGAGSSTSTPNVAASQFNFATVIGNCTVNGTLSSTLADDIDVFQ
jgi:hypothetical protein